MDGRWSLGLAAGFVGGMIGCATTPYRSPADVMKQPPDLAVSQSPKMPSPSTVAESPPPSRDKRLKSETLVKLGALKEQAAADPERSQAERDAFLYQARQSYQKSIDQDPKFAMGYMAMANSYLSSGEQDKAYAVFQKALKSNPTNAALWFELGSVQARGKDWTAALESLDRAAHLDPENKQYQKTYGLALARTGRFEDSYAVLVKCMSESEARFNIARMYKHVQQPDACQRQLQLALQANPDFAPAREMLDDILRSAQVKTAKYEESTLQKPSQTSTDPMNLPPVLIGGAGGNLQAPAKDGFDGTRK